MIHVVKFDISFVGKIYDYTFYGKYKVLIFKVRVYISKFHWSVKTKHILQLFIVRHFLETRLTFDLFLRFSFTGTFKNVNFEFPQNWTFACAVTAKMLDFDSNPELFPGNAAR